MSFAFILGPGLCALGYDGLGSTFLLDADAASFVVVAVDLVVWGGAMIGFALLVEGLAPNPWVIAAVFVLGGLGNPLHNVGIRTTIHRRVPENAQGRAWSYVTVTVNGCVVLGYLVGTPWASCPHRELIALSGALALLVSTYAIWRLRSVQRSHTLSTHPD